MKCLFARLVYAAAIMLTGCTMIVSGCEMNGRVVDRETGAPIPGALVIAEWKGDIGGPVQSSSVCFHLEVVTTDAEGRYHIPGWARRPATDSEGGFFGVRNVEVTRTLYKSGYRLMMYESKDPSTMSMIPARETTMERLQELAHAGTPGCGAADGSVLNESQVWKAVCDEVRAYPEARNANKAFRDQSFVDLINDHFSAIERDLESDYRGPPVSSAGRCLIP
jgi:hypothetical protein